MLNGTTNQAIIDFYHERYVPNNQVFVVVGDVKTQEVLDRVARQWTRHAARPRNLRGPGRRAGAAFAARVGARNGGHDLRHGAWPGRRSSSRTPTCMPWTWPPISSAKGESSRLVRRLKYDRQLVQSIDAASSTPHFVRGYFAVSASCLPETVAAGLARPFSREVYRLRDELVDAAELAKAKKQKAVEWLLRSPDGAASGGKPGRGFLAADDPLFDQAYADGHPEGDGRARSARRPAAGSSRSGSIA